MTDRKRQQIREKIAEGEARNRAKERASMLDRAGERAIEAKDRAMAFAKEHPVAVVVGGLALGILVSSLFRGSPTRKAAKKAGSRMSALAAVGAELALAYARHAMAAAEEARRAGSEQLGSLGDTLGETARDLGRASAETARGARERVSEALHRRPH